MALPGPFSLVPIFGPQFFHVPFPTPCRNFRSSAADDEPSHPQPSAMKQASKPPGDGKFGADFHYSQGQIPSGFPYQQDSYSTRHSYTDDKNPVASADKQHHQLARDSSPSPGRVSKLTSKLGAQHSTPAPRLPPNNSMSRRFYIETSATGKTKFVSIKRSRTPNGHQHHHHHRHGKLHHHHHHHLPKQPPQEPCQDPQDYCKVRIDDYKSLKERERTLQEAQTRLLADIEVLQTSLSTAQAEAHNLSQVLVPQLQNQLGILTTDNDALRKSLDKASSNEEKHCRQTEKLKQKVEKLKNEKKERREENKGLREKLAQAHRQRQQSEGSGCRRSGTGSGPGPGSGMSELLREIEYWKGLYRHWKDRYEDVKRRYDDVKRRYEDVCRTLDVRTEKVRVYEEILSKRRSA
ncbi:hypothetical protein E4U31_003147 [Claviceps sp. LM219 group G6]|nr:hypothetical protein E4U31_003147 [Claviceps sp. LM219 group G6]